MNWSDKDIEKLIHHRQFLRFHVDFGANFFCKLVRSVIILIKLLCIIMDFSEGIIKICPY